MINLRKFAVLLFIGVFTISMVMIPFTPMAADSQVAAPVNYEEALVEKYADILENDLPEKMDPILVSYMETGVLDVDAITTRVGDIKILLYVDPTFDTSALYDIAKVRWQMDLKVARVASIDVSSISALKQLEAMDGINYVMADRLIDRELDAFADDPVTDMFNINDVVGATGTYATDYDGSGVIMGVMDSGVDFSQLDMQNAEYNNGTHAQSYDPSSYGLTEMVIANNTYVENTTTWLAAGNLLTYEMGGKHYLDVTGWDPVTNMYGGPRSLMGLRGYGANDGYPEGPNVGWIGLYEWAWGINNGSEFVYNEMWKDWEIPAPGAENYTVGWAFQQRIDGYAKVFAASLYYEGDLIVDWNSSLAWTALWMDAFWYESIDLNVTADRDYITDMMDWSFEDDRLDGHVYNIQNNLLYADGLVDGSMAMGLGSISWAYDDLGWLTNDYGLFPGITEDGIAWNAMFPAGGGTTDTNHGHWTGAAIASSGVGEHEVYDNGTLYNLPGVAPGADLIATKGLSLGGGLMADFWASGFHLNESAGPHLNETYWTYGGDGVEHKADIVSNSWGWGPGSAYMALRHHALFYDLASVPGVMEPTYPGTLFVFSSGNSGSDYSTVGAPDSAFSVISVGATITGHYYESVYAPYTQTDSQEIYFSSNGPGYTGVVKPDVMAPGYRGVNPTPSHNEWGDYGDTYTWWQGTSLACPIAAGVAALIMEAWATAHSGAMPSPQLTKDLLLSSATDLGYDPFVQGHGLVNAEAAIAAIETGAADAYFFETNSFQYYAAQIEPAYSYWVPGWAPFGGIWYEDDWTIPVGLETSSIFFGTVDRNDAVTVNLDVTGYDGTAGDLANFDVETPWYYTQLSQVSFAETSYTYNDTNTFDIRPGVFFLEDNATLTDFYAANYATISVSYDIADIGDYPVVRLFDWVDMAPINGELNYYNFTGGGGGDYIDHISRYTDQCNLMQMRIAYDGVGGIANLFTGEPVIQFDGPAGIDFEVTIQAWTKTTDTAIGLVDGTTGIDVTLTVPNDAEYGAHEGMLYLEDTSSGFTHEIPYSYTVEFNLDAAGAGDVMTLVDGAGTELTPYDTGAATTSFTYGTTRIDEAGGSTVFHIEIPYTPAIAAEVLVMRAEWVNDGTVVDMYLRNERSSSPPLAQTDDGGGPFDGLPTGDKTNTKIWDPGDLINGTYWFYYVVHRFDGATVPEDITITFQLYGPAALTDAVDDFSWTAKDSLTPAAIAGGMVLEGDHVVLNSTWSIPDVSGLPEYSVITGTRITFLSGLYATRPGFYADPGGTDAWPVPITWPPVKYVWETVDGVAAEDITTVTLDAEHGADPSFDVYMWDDADADEEVDEGELASGVLLSVDNGGGGAVEFGTFTVPESGALAIRVFCWAWAYPGDGADYTLTVDSQVAIDLDSETGTPDYVGYDTYNFERNVNFTVRLTCWTETDVVWILPVGMVRFQSYYTPEITVNAAVDLGGDLFNFTWDASDGNIDDTLYFSVWISSDDGNTYSLFGSNLTDMFFVWDSDGFLIDDYMYQIRVYDCDHTYPLGVGAAAAPPSSYWPGLFASDSSASFEAGNVIYTPPVTTTTTTPPPTTTTTTPPPEPGIDPLLIGLLGGIGVGVVILLILFLIRKK
ncbi:MAG: S8 family serine peptidase [Candidatus Thorarchaeota archaeon]